MKNTVRFGAGNIGRGFIGDILSKDNVAITFVDVDERVIDELNKWHSYEIEVAEEGQLHIVVKNVSGVNNTENPDEVIKTVASADIITTVIGPSILPFIAELIAKGIEARKAAGNNTPISALACENMTGGSQYLYQEMKKYLSAGDLVFAEQYVGFPNAAVDCIVPAQTYENPLFVVVEPFNEWVVEASHMKNPTFKLTGAHYEKDLRPFIGRKLFSVNSDHATSTYTGASYGAKTILETLKDDRVKAQVEAVLGEIRSLLVTKWSFDEQALIDYHKIIISRFENPFIVDNVNRVARAPIRKLGYDECFICPIRELKERQLSYQNLLKTIAFVFNYNDSNDEQSVQLQEPLATKPLPEVVADVTGLTDQDLISEIVDGIENL